MGARLHLYQRKAEPLALHKRNLFIGVKLALRADNNGKIVIAMPERCIHHHGKF